MEETLERRLMRAKLAFDAADLLVVAGRLVAQIRPEGYSLSDSGRTALELAVKARERLGEFISEMEEALR